MKIIAESRVADTMPFTHLGYLAGSYLKPNIPFSGSAFVFFVATILTFHYAIGKGRVSIKKFSGAFKQNKKKVTVGLVLLAVTLVLTALAISFGERVLDHPVDMTEIRMRTLNETYRYLKDETASFPKDYNELIGEINCVSCEGYFEDGWFNKMKIVERAKDGKPEYVVVSAGPDETFDTEDDIVYILGTEYGKREKKPIDPKIKSKKKKPKAKNENHSGK